MKKIRDKDNRCVAFVLRPKDYLDHKEKRFYSDPDDSIQVGSLYFSAGKRVEPHIHKDKYVSVVKPVEVLLVLSSSVIAHIYGDDKKEIEVVALSVGDVLVQRSGGHGFEFQDGFGTRLLEFKCGPYSDKKSDKEMIR